jgi:hypothetical protein
MLFGYGIKKLPTSPELKGLVQYPEVSSAFHQGQTPDVSCATCDNCDIVPEPEVDAGEHRIVSP